MTTPSRHSAAAARRIVRRVIIEGTLVLQTPAHFGGGENDGITVLLLEDALTGRPLLPGASLAGALRHEVLRRERGFRAAEDTDTLAVTLFGTAYESDRGLQSRVIVDDSCAQPVGTHLETRDGVKIDPSFRTADDGALYTFNVWAAGTRFPLRLEVCLYGHDPDDADDSSADDADRLLGALATALNALGTGEIPLGARKHRGYGRGEVTDWRVHDYRLDTPNGLVDWVQTGGKALTDHPSSSDVAALLNVRPMAEDKRQYFRLDATFGLEDSLLIRAGSDVADMAHLMTHDGSGELLPVLSGTSAAGALRARAFKIANTLGVNNAKGLIDEMFGMFGDDDDTDSGLRTASRVIVEEHPIRNAIVDRVQNRVRIDRFTGGAFDTGLFGQQPVFATQNTEIRLKLALQYPANPKEQERARMDAQAGLLLLALKDLWTGDLALGGESSVGRGRLFGRQATLTFHDADNHAEIAFSGSPRDLNPEERETLEYFVRALQTQRKAR